MHTRSQGGASAPRGQRSILGFFSEADGKGAAASGVQQPSGGLAGASHSGPVERRSEDRGAESAGPAQPASCRDAADSSVEWERGVDGSWGCSQCGASILDEGRAEHEDYHLALLLQKAESGAELAGLLCPELVSIWLNCLKCIKVNERMVSMFIHCHAQ